MQRRLAFGARRIGSRQTSATAAHRGGAPTRARSLVSRHPSACAGTGRFALASCAPPPHRHPAHLHLVSAARGLQTLRTLPPLAAQIAVEHAAHAAHADATHVTSDASRSGLAAIAGAASAAAAASKLPLPLRPSQAAVLEDPGAASASAGAGVSSSVPAATDAALASSSIMAESSGPEITDLLIDKYASREARSVSLQEMIAMGSNPSFLLTAAQWLWEELPVRLAKRLRDLRELPFGLSRTDEVEQLVALYRQSLRDVLSMGAPSNRAEELRFNAVIKSILIRHEAVVVDLASGVNYAAFETLRREAAQAAVAAAAAQGDNKKNTSNDDTAAFDATKESSSTSLRGSPQPQHFILQDWLDRFNGMRVGSRLLMAQHVALHNPPREGWVGLIQLSMDPEVVIQQAGEAAAAVVRATLGVEEGCTPAIRVRRACSTPGGATSGPIQSFHYVPAHLRAMLFELLKNAMAATVTHTRRQRNRRIVPGTDNIDPYQKPDESDASSDAFSSSAAAAASSSSSSCAETFPALDVVVVDGLEDVVIRVSDRGGGIAREQLPSVFDYTPSPRRKSAQQRMEELRALARFRAKKASEDAAVARKEPASTEAVASSSSSPATTAGSEVLAHAAPVRPSASSSPLTKVLGPAASFLTGSGCEPGLNTALGDHSQAFGLPITRLYARCLGGDLQLRSVVGFSTDAFLYLAKPATNFKDRQA